MGTNVDGYLHLLQSAKGNLKAAQARKGEIPHDRPEAIVLVYDHMQSYHNSLASKTPTGKVALSTTVIGEYYHPSVAKLKDLEKILIKDLQLEVHHRGKFMLLRILTPPERVLGAMFIVGDEEGEGTMLSVYQQEQESITPAADIFHVGSCMILKEPWFKQLGSGGYGLRVDHPTDIVWLEGDDERSPEKWRVCKVVETAETLKLEGNKLFGQKKYLRAIEKYSSALASSPTPAEVEIIHNNRALAHIKLGMFEAAIEDVNYIVDINPRSEKGLYRGALALYNLGHFEECLEYAKILVEKYPADDIKKFYQRVQDRVKEQKTGEYNFKAMHKEAQNDPPNLDCATYVGPVEVRKVDGKGRGLFATSDVKAGDLLLCEKAFVHGFGGTEKNPSEQVSTLVNMNTDRVTIGTHASLIPKAYQKLVKNPSLAPQFLDLYHGSYEGPSETFVDGRPVVDCFLIERCISMNVFGCPARSSYQQLINKDNINKALQSSGVWIQASYINHSCIPNCQRTFIGDMLILRAARDISADTELGIEYYDVKEKSREKVYKNWGFCCNCELCQDEVNTSLVNLSRRKEILGTNSAVVYEFDIAKAETTYRSPVKDIPRYDLFDRLFESTLALSQAMHQGNTKITPSRISWYAVKALEAHGYVFEGINPKTGMPEKGGELKVKKWGVAWMHTMQLWQILYLIWAGEGYDDVVERSREIWKVVYSLTGAGDMEESFADSYCLDRLIAGQRA